MTTYARIDIFIRYAVNEELLRALQQLKQAIISLHRATTRLGLQEAFSDDDLSETLSSEHVAIFLPQEDAPKAVELLKPLVKKYHGSMFQAACEQLV